ncbi:MAG: hypothetical protein GY778_14160, partial [bacterium]|nr:hypothetical protein [bacterium]
MTVFAAGCGGGGGSQSGDRKGTDTKPRISGLQTPLGLQGTRGVGPNVALIYNLWDRDFDPADIEVEFGWDGASDGNADGLIGDGINTFPNEFVTATPAPVTTTRAGRICRKGYTIDRLILSRTGHPAMPALLFVPDTPVDGAATVWIHDRSKATDAGPGGPIERRALAGEIVLAIDLRGIGET